MSAKRKPISYLIRSKCNLEYHEHSFLVGVTYNLPTGCERTKLCKRNLYQNISRYRICNGLIKLDEAVRAIVQKNPNLFRTERI